ncbi:hypothetical protein EMCRGX_G031186 [Ephydatia muelleri]
MSEAAKTPKIKLPLLAKAHYNNVAERPDELSFRQGDTITVLDIDHNGQVDWWLCELRGVVGMVPANYLDVFHSSGPGYDTYDVPRSTAVSPHSVHSTHTDDGRDIYDLPPAEASVVPDPPDYDMPPTEGPDYDRPPSQSRSSTKSPRKDYDVPKSNPPVAATKRTNSCEEEPERSGSRHSLHAVDIEAVNDDEADDMLSDYRRLVSTTYENLYQSVYGPEAYWGTDNKARRMDTLQRTVTAAKYFDRALVALLGFGKGVSNTLETCSDANFKKKFSSAHQALIEKRQAILEKIEGLGMENETLTATVKALLELARTIPSSSTEFTVLVQANKALLFKGTQKCSLPVITKHEVKTRPLPELPLPPGSGDNPPTGDFIDDYASIPTEDNTEQSNGKSEVPQLPSPDDPNSESNKKKRNPTDDLPPLPFATLPRPPKGIKPTPKAAAQLPSQQQQQQQIGGTPQPPPAAVQQVTPHTKNNRDSLDYDVVDGQQGTIPRIPVANTPVIHNKVRKSSLGSSSGSSDENISNNVTTVNKIESPYGRPVANSKHTNSTSQPLRQEDRELLERFSQQMELIIPNLRETVDITVLCLDDNEPPKDFVNKSKLTVVAAYKLVYIADALCQKILHNDTKTAILTSSNRLTDVVKALVSDTKTAALQHPSVHALAKMSDSLKKLFPAALEVLNTVKTRASCY